MSLQKTESTESQASRVERFTGTVIWFNSSKGYGFLRAEDQTVNAGKDLFVHFHYLIQRGFKTLRKGDVVEFSLGTNKQGACALEVKILQASEEL